MSPETARKLKRAIRALVQAEINDSWMGGGAPSDWPYFAAKLKEARKKVDALITNEVRKEAQP